jgi:isopentenyl diphosphate isomerase/L-lactate dehydrogenase-like FMN-dependent dehydrogenase
MPLNQHKGFSVAEANHCVSARKMNVTVLEQTLVLPMLVAPMAFQCLAHADGELAMAKIAISFKEVGYFAGIPSFSGL